MWGEREGDKRERRELKINNQLPLIGHEEEEEEEEEEELSGAKNPAGQILSSYSVRSYLTRPFDGAAYTRKVLVYT